MADQPRNLDVCRDEAMKVRWSDLAALIVQFRVLVVVALGVGLVVNIFDQQVGSIALEVLLLIAFSVGYWRNVAVRAR